MVRLSRFVPLVGGLAVCVAVAGCGRDPNKKSQTELPVMTEGNTPAPDPSLNAGSSGNGTGPTNTQPPKSSHEGSIVDLRAISGARSGLPVKLTGVVVVSNSGNGSNAYLSDQEVTAGSGIELERCGDSDTTCKRNPKPVGTVVDVTGTLFINRDGSWVIGKVTAMDEVPDEAAFYVTPALATVAQVEKGSLKGNEDLRALPVTLVDEDGSGDAVMVVHDLTPEDDKNNGFPETLDAQCGVENLQKPENSAAVCCPSGIGPKYYSFTLKDKKTGKLVSVSTTNYRDIQFNAWPCGARDAANALKVGDEFSRFGGIFDVKFQKASIAPASTADYVLIRK